ncbi:hypothetical protein [Streptomyces sp. NPDC058486]|uniref:hypothetical protein n=1 Tax=unclassified Streptomyces TaxID=2593676 RepID=UPI00365B6775
MAERGGWQVDDESSSVARYVDQFCRRIAKERLEEQTRPQWVVENGYFWEDGPVILEAGVPMLCPEWTDEVTAAASGTYERWFTAGQYRVSPKPTREFREIAAGVYRAERPLPGCSWKRAAKGGDVLDGRPAEGARTATVTLAASDRVFMSANCGTWKPVT